MLQNKLSISTRTALQNNFADLPKDNNGRVSAFLKVSKNVDSQLTALGVWISPKSNPNALLFTIAFPPSSIGQLTEIDGVEYVDVGDKVSIKNDVVNTGSGNSSTNNPSTGSNKFVWTPMKKVVAGALAIGAVLGMLKLAKVI